MSGTYPVQQGAEPFSSPGGPHGALVLHGFTGSPQAVRGLAEAFAAAGFAVELPRLPGHGTAVEEMAETGWDDWSRTAEDVYADLAARCERVVVAGLSMGATLTLSLTARHPEIAGVVLVNALAEPSSLVPVREAAQAALDAGQAFLPGVGGDVAKPEVVELAYESMPAASLVSLVDALAELAPRLGEIRAPALLVHSLHDHVVARDSFELIERSLAGPVDVLELERSYHVATLDHDAELIEKRAVAFAMAVVGRGD